MIDCSPDTSQRFLRGCLSADDEHAFVAHLDACATCQQLLESNAAPADDWRAAKVLLRYERSVAIPTDEEGLNSAAAALLAPSDDPRMLGRIGTHEVLGVIGRGGMGIVFKGYDRALHRNVAIKMLEPHLASIAAARRRFALEARAMAAVSHEHVVPVYAVDDQAPSPYFVMEYVAGGSLENRLLRQGPFDVLEVIRIALQMSRALDAAHRQGLVHRDIKPGNVLLDAGTERVRVADFGLARVTSDASMSHSGMIAGTPHYMSPEQVRGDACDARSDLFSLGGVIYALCTGHPPFRAENMYGVMQRVVNDAPRPLRELNPPVPEWLESLTARLLAKSPDERVESAAALAGILEAELAYLQNPRSAPQPMRDWMPRNIARQRRRANARYYALCGLAVLVLAACFAVAARLPDAPMTSGSTPSPARSNVPLWGADGMSDAQRLTAEIESRWSATPTLPADAWNVLRDDAERQSDALLRQNSTDTSF